MRDLTKEELALAPDWATHYIVDTDNSIIYESINLCWWEGLDSPSHIQRFDDGVRLIPKKPFDISEHEFSDSIAEIKAKANAGSTIKLDVFEKWITLNKPDAIAIAKALGVTGEDLI